MDLTPEVRAQFDVDWDGPARLIYQWTIMGRRIASTKQMMAEALRREMSPPPPPDAPQIVVPSELMTDVRREAIRVPGPAGAPEVRALVYYPPPAAAPPPVLLFIHGGGWTMGEPEGTDLITRKLCWLARVVVVSTQYRVAPEHPFPAGLDDCLAAYDWIREHARARLGADPARVAVGGDSAGGNLAAALTLRARDQRRRRPDASLLICPPTDLLFENYESCRRLGPNSLVYDLPFLGFVRGAYAADTPWTHPHLSPMHGDLRDFGPTLIVAAGQDPLLDDNRAFAAKLRAAGNPDVELHVYDAMPHAFYYFLGLSTEEDEAYQAMACFLRRVLAGPDER